MTKWEAVLVLLVVVPVPLVALVALLRGYDVHVALQRRRRGDDG